MQVLVAEIVDGSRAEGSMLPKEVDLALRFDPIYEPISRRFMENPEEFADAFAKAWYKLLHRDMGPISRYLGPWVPEEQIWQDPVPAASGEPLSDADIAALVDLRRALLANVAATANVGGLVNADADVHAHVGMRRDVAADVDAQAQAG